VLHSSESVRISKFFVFSFFKKWSEFWVQTARISWPEFWRESMRSGAFMVATEPEKPRRIFMLGLNLGGFCVEILRFCRFCDFCCF